ncbi:MAG: exodeoxyribonuclease VII small subunit [Thermoanaerobacterales bacterium]|nr:exodeoxyribonuclease VII small subunit [Bacillota bacterium]MDI6906774.1 exodeoxyribonuclease VII small subunit [Thermoanaerobacterales bacterium]
MAAEATFEESLGRLEEVVRQLEDGDLPLEKALDLYAEGVALARYCHGLLERAEQQVRELSLAGDGDDQQGGKPE